MNYRLFFCSRSLSDSKSQPRDGTAWTGESNRSRNFNYKENTVTISINESMSPTKEAGKARPVWMTESTVDGASNDAVKLVIAITDLFVWGLEYISCFLEWNLRSCVHLGIPYVYRYRTHSSTNS